MKKELKKGDKVSHPFYGKGEVFDTVVFDPDQFVELNLDHEYIDYYYHVRDSVIVKMGDCELIEESSEPQKSPSSAPSSALSPKSER